MNIPAEPYRVLKDPEILIFDDGSTDDTLAVAEQHRQGEPAQGTPELRTEPWLAEHRRERAEVDRHPHPLQGQAGAARPGAVRNVHEGGHGPRLSPSRGGGRRYRAQCTSGTSPTVPNTVHDAPSSLLKVPTSWSPRPESATVQVTGPSANASVACTAWRRSPS